MAKFLLRNHVLSICNDMTVKQQIKDGAIQKAYHLHNGILKSINLCHTFPPPLCYLLKIIIYWNERKEDYLYK